MITISISGDAGQAHIQKAREIFENANPTSGVYLCAAEPRLDFPLEIGTVAEIGSALAGIATFLLTLIRRSSESSTPVPTKRHDAEHILQISISLVASEPTIRAELRNFREEPGGELLNCTISVKGSGLPGALEVEINKDAQGFTLQTRSRKLNGEAH